MRMLRAFLDLVKALKATDWTAIIGSLVGVFSLYLNWRQKNASAKTGASQAEAAKRSAELAERSAKAAEKSAWASVEGMKISQRPWIAVVSKIVDWEQPLARLPKSITLIFRNGGNTPALKTKSTAYFRITKEFSLAYDGAGEAQENFGVIGPDTNFNTTLSLVADDNMKRTFLEGNAILYAFGQVTYEDIFCHKLTYSWAYVYKPDMGFEHSDIHHGITDSPPQSELQGSD